MQVLNLFNSYLKENFLKQFYLFKGLQKKLYELCNCTDPQSLSLFDSTTCQSDRDQECMTLKYDMLVNSNFLTSSCLPLCPLECNRTEFTTSVSTVEIIGNLYADFINSKTNLMTDFNQINQVTPDEAKIKICPLVFVL